MATESRDIMKEDDVCSEDVPVNESSEPETPRTAPGEYECGHDSEENQGEPVSVDFGTRLSSDAEQARG